LIIILKFWQGGYHFVGIIFSIVNSHTLF